MSIIATDDEKRVLESVDVRVDSFLLIKSLEINSAGPW